MNKKEREEMEQLKYQLDRAVTLLSKACEELAKLRRVKRILQHELERERVRNIKEKYEEGRKQVEQNNKDAITTLEGIDVSSIYGMSVPDEDLCTVPIYLKNGKWYI